MLSYDVAIYQRGGYTYAYREDGKQITKVKAGADAAKLFKAVVDATPDKGSIHIGRGLYLLSAPHLFQLNADGSNPFYCCIPVFDKSIHIHGAGVGATILRLMPGQRKPGRHVAMILARGTGNFMPGYDGLTVANMTLDGNREQQEEGAPKDGESLILAGSKRQNGRYCNIELINSYGSGLYLGNNGSGYEDGASVSHVVARDCAEIGVILDNCQHSQVSDCMAWGCREGLHLNGDDDWQTRSRDWVQVSGFQTDSPVTIWKVNNFYTSGLKMDCSATYGFVVRDGVGHVKDSVFVNTPGRAAYVYGDSRISLSGCHLEGCYGLQALGRASVVAQSCRMIAPGGCFVLEGSSIIEAAGCRCSGPKLQKGEDATFQEF